MKLEINLKRIILKRIILLFIILFSFNSCSNNSPQNNISSPTLERAKLSNYKPKVLGVIAHPDDETSFSATWFSITKLLNGVADLIVVTNGEGGYKYSSLAELTYNAELTKESVGRELLPEIRKKELRDAGDIIGIRDIIHINEKDHRYTKDEQEVFNGIWNTEKIKDRIKKQIQKENYDAVFVLFPSLQTHGHHKATTILTLQAINDLEKSRQPIVLASSSSNSFNQLNKNGIKNYPLAKLASNQSIYSFDRSKKFGFKNKLDFNIITNWHIAAHKSQGTLQLFVNKNSANENSRESFWALGNPSVEALKKAENLFIAMDKAIEEFQASKKSY